MEDMFLSVLNMSLTASYVIAVIMLVRLFLKKAPKAISYTLWAIAGFRLVFPFSFESVFSLIPFKSTPIPTDIAIQPIPRVDSGIRVVDNAVNQVLPAATPAASMNQLQIWLTVGSYLWLAGITVMLIYSLVSIVLLKRRLNGAMVSEGNIYEADNLKTPFVLGLFRPRIYIPTGLSKEEKRYIIMHERTHIRRCDHIVKFFAYFILCLHWFNPLVWVAFLLMGADMEMSCDERVLTEMGGDIKKAYSTSLLSLATGRRLINGSPLAFGEGNIKGRIKNVLNFKKPAVWVVAISAIAVVAICVGLMSNRSVTQQPWSPQPVYENQDDYFAVLAAARASDKTEEIAVEDMGDNEKTALAWMKAWLNMYRTLPEDNMAYIADGVVDRLYISKVSKEGLPKAFVFSVIFSVRPTYPIAQGGFWAAGNTTESPGRDETWGQMSREVELRLENDGKYHYVSSGTGVVGSPDIYDMVSTDISGETLNTVL